MPKFSIDKVRNIVKRFLEEEEPALTTSYLLEEFDMESYKFSKESEEWSVSGRFSLKTGERKNFEVVVDDKTEKIVSSDISP